MTGWNNAPDYGSPAPKRPWRGFALFLAVWVAVAVVLWLAIRST